MNKKIEIEQYFPLGMATGKAFLGRKTEVHQLQENIQQHRHTLLLAPRQYGKSSLARCVLQDLQRVWVGVDLFLGLSDVTVVNCFLTGFNKLISSLSSTPEQLLLLLKQFFVASNKKWKLSLSGVSLEIEPEKNHEPAQIILEGLQTVEHLLKKKKQKAVFFVDEFQEISKLPAGREIEGAIRHYAQESGHITFIFSGSNRHLLQNIFEDSQRPLYELCDWMVIKRLRCDIYQPYLNKVAHAVLQQSLKKDVFETIVQLSELHPRRIYALCGRVWARCKREGSDLTSTLVEEEWHHYVNERAKSVRQELAVLSAGQLKLLIAIAIRHNDQITSKSIQRFTDLTSSSIVHNLGVLEEKDFLEKNEGNTICIIDPLIKSALQKHYPDGI